MELCSVGDGWTGYIVLTRTSMFLFQEKEVYFIVEMCYCSHELHSLKFHSQLPVARGPVKKCRSVQVVYGVFA